MKFSNKVYDLLKMIAQVALPAAGTLYFALAKIWGLPFGHEIVGTITAVDAFLGVLLGVSNYNYNKPVCIEINDPVCVDRKNENDTNQGTEE